MNRLTSISSKAQYEVGIFLNGSSKTFTNGDTVSGKVIVKPLNVNVKTLPVTSLFVALKGTSDTMLEDSRSTPRFDKNGETHEILNIVETMVLDDEQGPFKTYSFEFKFPEDDFNLQCLSEGEFLHKRGYVKDDLVIPPVTLPPSLLYEKGADNYAKIEYSIQVSSFKTPTTTKPTTEATLELNFLPKVNLVTFVDNKVANTNNSGQAFDFKYLEANSNTTTNNNESTLLSPTNKLKHIFKKALPNSKISADFELQATFIPHLEPYNSQYNTPRILQVGDNLKDCLKLTLYTNVSYDDLIRKVYPSNANTSAGNLTIESEKLILNSLKAKLVSTLSIKSQIFNDKREFKSIIVDHENMNYPISHENFQLVDSDNFSSITPQSTAKSQSTITTDTKNHLIKAKDELYKLQLPQELLNGQITSMVPSFAACNIKIEHELHISAKFSSFWNPKLQSSIKLTPSIILLKDYFNNQYSDELTEDYLPVYTPLPESSTDN